MPVPAMMAPRGLLWATMLAVTAAQMDVEVDAPDGKLRCGLVGASTRQCLAIPFAAPPIRDLRWRAPQPVRKWSGVRPATAARPGCIQDNWRKGTPTGQALSEDCARPFRPPPHPQTHWALTLSHPAGLYLNVYSPRTPSKDPRGYPVILWIQ